MYSLAYSKPQAIVLSDAELDNISAAGFDININAAYAFRAAVINQSNIATVACINGNAKININATNQAMAINQGNPTLTNQSNISAIIDKIGNIKDAIIKNFNTVSVQNGDTSVPQAPISIETTANFNIPAAIPECVETPLGHQAPAPVETPVSLQAPAPTSVTNGASTNTLSAVVQTNIAAVVALNGSVENANIDNLNSAFIEKVGNSALADQINIAVVIAKDNISAKINNINTASVEDMKTTNSVVDVASLFSGNDAIIKYDITKVAMGGSAQAIQTNITFVKSLGGNGGDFKKKLFQELDFIRKIANFH